MGFAKKLHHSGEPTSIDEELTSLVCERLSHAMRTPLGVAKGVIDDLVDGFQISSDDLKDAENAISKLIAILESVRDFSNLKQPELKSCSLYPIVLTEVDRFKNSLQQLSLRYDSSSEQAEVSLDSKLTARMLHGLITYGLSRCERFPEERARLEIELSAPEQSTDVRLSLKCSHAPATDLARAPDAGSLREIPQFDYSFHSLFVLPAAKIIELHGAEASYRKLSSRQLHLFCSWPRTDRQS